MNFGKCKNGADGLQSYCRPCHDEYMRDYRPVNRVRIRANDKRWRDADLERTHATYRKWDLQTSFGISPEEYEEMLEAQDGVCVICGTEPGSPRAYGRRLAVDHEHQTGKVRRLLCGTCNRALGMMAENVDWLQRAVRYLEEVKDAVYNPV